MHFRMCHPFTKPASQRSLLSAIVRDVTRMVTRICFQLSCKAQTPPHMYWHECQKLDWAFSAEPWWTLFICVAFVQAVRSSSLSATNDHSPSRAFYSFFARNHENRTEIQSKKKNNIRPFALQYFFECCLIELRVRWWMWFREWFNSASRNVHRERH